MTFKGKRERKGPLVKKKTLIQTLPRPQSLAISGGHLSKLLMRADTKGVMGRGPRSRCTLVPIIPLSRFTLVSRAREFPTYPWERAHGGRRSRLQSATKLLRHCTQIG